MTNSTHSLISPSNFERRMLCPGSLNAEKDLPEKKSVYAAEGTLLHERTAQHLLCWRDILNRKNKENKSKGQYENILTWYKGLTDEQILAVDKATNYYYKLLEDESVSFIEEFHEQKYSLSFIYPDMKGTADSVVLLDNKETKLIELHVIDYKFGKGVPVEAKNNYQLILYYLGVINDPKIQKIIREKDISVHLHIVQPYIKNSRWDLTEEEVEKVSDISFYKKVAEECYRPDVKRISSSKACKFCKAKPTCPVLAKKVPKLDIDVFDLETNEIVEIYESREQIKLYLDSIEDYMVDKIASGDIKNYEVVERLSNRKWKDSAEEYLRDKLDSEAYENTNRLISIGKAEKLLSKEEIKDYVEKTKIGTKIRKIEKL